MDVALLTRFFAIALLCGIAATVILAARTSSRGNLKQNSLVFASVVAVGGTLASLYYSEVAGFIPCELCWYQRIAMYPLALILPQAAIRQDTRVLGYARSLAVIGLLLALYHSQLQAFPDLGSFCEAAQPCTSSPIKTLGWITIPHMSALSFALITALASLGTPSTQRKP